MLHSSQFDCGIHPCVAMCGSSQFDCGTHPCVYRHVWSPTHGLQPLAQAHPSMMQHPTSDKHIHCLQTKVKLI